MAAATDFELLDKYAFVRNTNILFSTEYSHDKNFREQYTSTDNGHQADKSGNRDDKKSTQEPFIKVLTRHYQYVLKGTTLHGLRRVCTPGVHSFRRALWLVLLLAMCASYAYMATSAIKKYTKFESSNKISTIAVDKIPFPAISVCQQNKYPKTKVQGNEELQFWMKYFETQHNPHADLNESARSRAAQLLNQYKFFDLFDVNFDELIVSCKFGGVEFPCRERFVDKVSDSSACYTFMNPSHMEQPLSMLPGYQFGLQIWINTNVDNYFISVTNGLGVKVIVHDPRSHPRPSEQAIAIAPGIDAYLRLEKNVVSTLRPPYSEVECVPDNELENYQYQTGDVGVYSYEGCLLDCMLVHVTIACKCSFSSATPNNSCTMQHVYFCMADELRNYYTRCHCLYPCKQDIYDVQLSMLNLPAPLVRELALMKDFVWKTETDIRRNMIHLSVAYDSMQYTQTSQVPAYGVDELVANLGGQLGLFLGASVITMLELIEWLSTTICTIRRIKRQ